MDYHAYPPSEPGARPASPRQLLLVAVLAGAIGSGVTYGLASAAGGAPLVAIQPAPTSSPVAAEQAVSTDAAQDLTDVVARATQSVVTITAESVGRSRFSPFDIPSSGVGSGIIVSADGLILTNNHVVEGAERLTVTTADGRELGAVLVAREPDSDIAVIRADADDLVAATLGNTEEIEVGQSVLAIGSPLGEFTETVTRGIVSALGRSITVVDEQTGRRNTLEGLIQTDAAINPGNSGGPLINDRGEVIGINSAVSRAAEGIGFAIPIDAARELIDQAVAAIA